MVTCGLLPPSLLPGLSGHMLPPVQMSRPPSVPSTRRSSPGVARLTRWPPPATHSASAPAQVRATLARLYTLAAVTRCGGAVDTATLPHSNWRGPKPQLRVTV